MISRTTCSTPEYNGISTQTKKRLTSHGFYGQHLNKDQNDDNPFQLCPMLDLTCGEVSHAVASSFCASLAFPMELYTCMNDFHILMRFNAIIMQSKSQCKNVLSPQYPLQGSFPGFWASHK